MQYFQHKKLFELWNCYGIVKKKLAGGKFFNSLCSLFFAVQLFYIKAWTHDVACSKYTENLGNKKLSVKHTLSKTAMIET